MWWRKLWETRVMGTDSPQALLSTVFFYNGLNFVLRGGEEHCQLKISQLKFCTVSDPLNWVSRQLAIHDSILISALGLVPVLIWILTCTISNSLYFVFLLCSIIIAIVTSDGCMSGKQAICMDLNKWCILFIDPVAMVTCVYTMILNLIESFHRLARDDKSHIRTWRAECAWR